MATIPVTDVRTGLPAGEVSVNNTWNATTEATREYAGWPRETFRSPSGYRVSVRTQGRAALAEAESGTPQLFDATIGRHYSLRTRVSACPR